MREPRSLIRLVVAGTSTTLLLSGAAAAGGAATGTAAEPESITHSDNIEKVDKVPFKYGTDLAFNGNLVAAGSAAWDPSARKVSGVHILKRHRDGTLSQLSFINCSAWHSDVAWVGHRYVVQSNDTTDDNATCNPGLKKEGVRVIDARRPRDPRSVGFAATVHGAHNITAVPGTGLVYVSSYNLTDPTDVDGVSIVDVGANPKHPPVRFLEFPDADNSDAYPDMTNKSGTTPTSPGCHDIGLDMQHHRAFCAGITETMIWDISRPRHPVIESIIRNPDISIHHGARVNRDGDILLLQDEWLGASGANTGCLVPHQPSGTIWFYDISDPKNPKPLGYWSAPTPDPTADFCTTHFYRAFTMTINGHRHDMLSTSYYQHGVYVVDFTNPASPKTHAYYEPDGANFWSAYPYRGKLYANSFAPATMTGSDPSTASKGGVWALRLKGYQ